MALFLCSPRILIFLLLISAIPVAYIISVERAEPTTHVFHYHSNGYLRECAKWDEQGNRFLVTYMEGGVGEVHVPKDHSPDAVLKEVTVVKEFDLAGNASLGMSVDRPRNRLLVAVADLFGNRYSGLAAYDLSTWKRLFLTHLPSDEKSFADDVAVDADGTAYVTDVKGSKIWKVGVNGELLSVLRNPLFNPKEWYKTLFGLNGIVYHPDGYLIVIHTFSGNLLKIDLTKGEEVKLIQVTKGSLQFGDGIELVSPTKLVVAGNPSARLVESSDGWETASVVGQFKGPAHRLATAATVKDGKVYLSHMFVHQQTHFQFNKSFLTLGGHKPVTAQSLSSFDIRDSAETVKHSTLQDIPLVKPENASGSDKVSVFKEIQEQQNESQVLEEEGDNENEDPETEQEGAPAPSAEDIEVESNELIEKDENRADSVDNKLELPSSTEHKEEKKINVTPVDKNEVPSNGKIEEKKIDSCDLTKGKWVYDESYPLYTNASCPFIDEGFNCDSNGRRDRNYMKWRWQPQDCDFPRFNAAKMLDSIRGKRLVFVGDSINRNQWESMLCMLMAAVKDPKKVYETHGRRITKEKGNYSFKFVDYKCTVEYYVSHYLVHESKARIGQKRRPTLRIDAIDHGSSRWRGADILVFNSAHWWSHYKTKAGVNYYQEGNQVHPKLDVSTAFRRALMTWGSWVDRHINPGKTQVFFRNSAPSHFSGGEWNSGGHCLEAAWPLNDTSAMNYPEKNKIVEEVVLQMKTPVTLLNITGLSAYRIDGHPSIYGKKPGTRFSSKVQDCSHWCLPGVPDAWNEILYVHLQSKLKYKNHSGS
ncbi:Six-bladed beta-propeller, TolB-like protein [Corchorus olitorius]|uniref:Six-bladed beta-propeller, TolB-like protein n=1 Tax=Corchorus olitorius TaxID=93759 RepID=A0A1R3IHY4_9ROSI|nr:Six-bladed beta-propeller, TolB-like protein [Corchorus olitorius]